MKVLEIVFGNSCYYTIRNSNLKDNKILMFNTLFNVGDLSTVSDYKISIPDSLCFGDDNYLFKEESNTIVDAIKNNYKIRVWTSRYDIYSYLVMLYVSSIIYKYNYSMFLVYSDDYDDKFISCSVMNEEELEGLSKLEHKIVNEELKNNVNLWNSLIKKNDFFRVIENGCVISTTINYYDNYILDTLRKKGKVKMFILVLELMVNVHISDSLFVYLINNLIKQKKILISYNEDRYFDSIIEAFDV